MSESELGSLSQCMVDSDAASKSRARRLRRKALAVSVTLEAVVIGGVMLWPLATLGVLPPPEVVTPVPPFHGMSAPQHGANPPHTIRTHAPTIFQDTFRQPLAIPPHIETGPGPEPPSIDEGSGPVGSGVLGGLGDGSIEIVPPPRPQIRTVVRGAQVMEAMLVHRVDPEYPSIAKTMHLSGTVILRATIGTDGEVRNLEVESGHPILAEASRRAVLQWRYRPTTLNGQAVEVQTEITVKFILNE